MHEQHDGSKLYRITYKNSGNTVTRITAQLNASAVYAMILRLSVRLSLRLSVSHKQEFYQDG